MLPPVVTGVSPKEGPPGTRVTIRGENLGTKASDIIGVEICGSDCTLSAEWKSPNKIVARSGPGKGRGQIIVSTMSGGRGTCTVEFRGFHERITPLKESAVWVEEASPIGSGPWAKGSSFHVEDPLGLSVESDSSTKKLPEDDLLELFPGCNGDLSSEQFSPGWFLLQHHQSTSFDDLRVGLAYLRRKVDGHKEGQLTFLKGNVSSVMEQLEVLEALQAAFHKDIEREGLNRTTKIIEAIEKSKEEGKVLFDGVLKGKEKADRTRNALGVLQRFKFLFTLPAAIDRSMEKADYDTIISDYSRANNLFGKTDVKLFKEVLAQVKLKVVDIKGVLKAKLYTMPNTLETQKKLIRNLVQLEYEGDPGWEAIDVHFKYINGQLNECYRFHIANLDKNTNESKSKASKKEKDKLEKQSVQNMAERVECIEDLCDILSLLLPELWSLGQSYFSGDLHIKPDQSKLPEFKTNTLGCVGEMCRLVRSIGWAQGKSAIVGTFPHCLKHLRSAEAQLSQIPHDPVSSLIYHFRMECVKSVLTLTGEQTKELTTKENWAQIHEPKYGLITNLPSKFEELVSSSFTTLKDSALAKDTKETDLFSSDQIQKETGQLVLAIFNNYIQAIEALSVNGDEEQSMAVSQLGTTTFRQPHLSMPWEERVLSCICNVRYSAEVTLPSLISAAALIGLPPLDWVLKESVSALGSLRNRLEYSYIEAKSDPLVGTIEPSMYIGHFDWDTELHPTQVRPYANEIIANLVAVHSQLERACEWLRASVLTQIIETVAEEVSRLMLCASNMSVQGAEQAHLDLRALESTLSNYMSQQAKRFLTEAREAITPLDSAANSLVTKLLDDYKRKMYLHLYAFNTKPNV